MPDQYQTPPKPSSLQAKTPLGDYAVSLSPDSLQEKDLDITGLLAFQRAANYLAAAQIFLQSNTILQGPLTKDDIKPRLLGHWGTCAGLTLVYAHASYLITRHSQKSEDVQMLFVTGPGHGAPSILSTLFIEVRPSTQLRIVMNTAITSASIIHATVLNFHSFQGTISRFYSQYSLDEPGLKKFIRSFSWPGGFPSHVNAETPGSIHEGGELGYALAVAYGAVMDKPDLIAVALVNLRVSFCAFLITFIFGAYSVIGDGESETGPTATA